MPYRLSESSIKSLICETVQIRHSTPDLHGLQEYDIIYAVLP